MFICKKVIYTIPFEYVWWTFKLNKYLLKESDSNGLYDRT